MTPTSVGNSLDQDELAEIGVSTGAPTGGTITPDSVDGKLAFDEAKFRKALRGRPGRRSSGCCAARTRGRPRRALDAVIKPFTEARRPARRAHHRGRAGAQAR